MPTKSPEQKKLMQAAAHTPGGYGGVPQSVGKEFIGKDAESFGASVRWYDEFGRLHVEISNISKANVCGYYGREIPDSDRLGLQQDKMYQLWRHPEELAKAAETFNNLPLMIIHVPQTADDPQKDSVIGALGTDAEFSAPYLRNSMIFWDAVAIAGIETEEQCELSAGYRYEADMTPGVTPDGVAFDGVMRNLRGNHVALVEDGRAGSDVVVGDSNPKEKLMPRNKPAPLSRRAAAAFGALTIHLAPKFAMATDGKPAPAAKALPALLSRLLRDVNAANFSERKADIVAGLKLGLRGKLAMDAELGDVVELLDKLDDAGLGMIGELDEEQDKEVVGDEDSSVVGKVMNFLSGLGIQQSDLEVVRELLTAGAQDEEPDDKKEDALKKIGEDSEMSDEEKKEAKDAFEKEWKDAKDEADKDKVAAKDWKAIGKDMKAAKDAKAAMDDKEDDKDDKTAKDEKDDKNMVTKEAMDSAIAAASRNTETATIKRLRAVREAEIAVQPYIGTLTMAMDSADAVYRLALTSMDVDIKGVHPSAYPAMLKLCAKPGEPHRQRRENAMAMDSATREDYYTRWPAAKSARHA